MPIDWFTITAQALNFVVLVWLLKRFLYKPILRAIDDREKRIAEELAYADRKSSEAEKERSEFRRKNEEFGEQKDSLLSGAKKEAESERRRLFDEARQAAADYTLKRKKELEDEEANLQDELRRRTREEVFAVSRKALSDLAEASLEERIVDVFLRRLRDLDEKDKRLLVNDLKEFPDSALLRTGFELSSSRTSKIEEAVKEALGSDSGLRFETEPRLIGGIELVTKGRKIAWSIADYLKTMEERL